MPVSVVETKEPGVMLETAMPPPVGPARPEPPLFRDIDELRSGHGIRDHWRERMLHIGLALVGTGFVFGILYASMLFLE